MILFACISVDGSFDAKVFMNIFWCWGRLEPQKKLGLQRPPSTILKLQKFDVSNKWSEVTSSDLNICTGLGLKMMLIKLIACKEQAIQNICTINLLKNSQTSPQAALSDLRATSDLRELNILYLNEFPNLTLATKLAQLTSSDLQQPHSSLIFGLKNMLMITEAQKDQPSHNELNLIFKTHSTRTKWPQMASKQPQKQPQIYVRGQCW